VTETPGGGLEKENFMIGTISTTGKPQKLLSAAYAARDAMRAIGWVGRKQVKLFVDGNGRYGKPIAKTVRQLERAVAWSAQFPMVEFDESCTRLISVKTNEHYSSDAQVEAPLLFRTRLPASTKTKMTFRSGETDYSAIAITPMPTMEAIQAIRQHGKKFDELQLWWVPHDILGEKIPDPDPMVVGVIHVPGHPDFFFELHRWIDETVEASWWTREGY
jgi:hypothetical protein